MLFLSYIEKKQLKFETRCIYYDTNMKTNLQDIQTGM
jgi:hypothetical protein